MASHAVTTDSSPSTESSSLTSTNKPLKILVIGAGVAGLSAAIGLRRTGHDVEVLPLLLDKDFHWYLLTVIDLIGLRAVLVRK